MFLFFTVLGIGSTGGSVGPVLGPKSYTTGVKIIEGDTAVNQALGELLSVAVWCVSSLLSSYFFSSSYLYLYFYLYHCHCSNFFSASIPNILDNILNNHFTDIFLSNSIWYNLNRTVCAYKNPGCWNCYWHPRYDTRQVCMYQLVYHIICCALMVSNSNECDKMRLYCSP